MPVKAKYENLNLSTSPAISVQNVIFYSSWFKKKKKTFQSDKKKKSKQKNITFFLLRNPLMYSLIHKNIPTYSLVYF